MSNVNVSVSGPAEGARRATDAGPETGRGGKGRWSAKRKASVDTGRPLAKPMLRVDWIA